MRKASSPMTSNLGTDSNEPFQLLCDLGLTPVQSKVFLALQNSAGLSAHAIVDTLRINRVDVYRALQNLRSAGLIEVSIGKPNRYIAMEPNAAIKLLLKGIEDDVVLLKQKASRLTKALEVQRSIAPERQTIEGQVQFFRLKSGEAVINSIREIIGGARTEVRKVVTVRALSFHTLYGVTEMEKRLAKKGVTIKILTDAKSDKLKEHASYARIRFAGDLTDVLRYIIVDDRLVLISLAANATGPTDSVGLLTNNATLVHALTNHFDELWQRIPD